MSYKKSNFITESLSFNKPFVLVIFLEFNVSTISHPQENHKQKFKPHYLRIITICMYSLHLK